MNASAGAALAGFVVLACSLTSLDGFSGGDPNAVFDAAGADSAPADADAGGDGAATKPFCDSLSPKATFCDDFERSDPKGAWEELRLLNGPTIVIQPSKRTQGGELFASVAFAASGAPYSGELTKTFPATSEVRMAFAYETDFLPTMRAVQSVSMVVATGGNDRFAVYLMTRPSGVTLVEQSFPGVGGNGIFKEHFPSVEITVATRHRIEIEAKLTAPPRLTLTVDGKLAYSAAADAALRPGSVTAAVGIHYGERPGGPLDIHVDDVAIYVK